MDCEFTGLSLKQDTLLEVSAIIAQDVSKVAFRMAQDDWCLSRPDHQHRMLDEIERSVTPIGIADEALATIVGLLL